MKDYDKNYFWTTIDSITNEKKYFFRINGTMVEVTKEIYNCCFNSYIKELRHNRRNAKNPVLSLEHRNAEGHNLIDNLQSNKHVETEVINKILIEIIMQEIELLNADDKKIILENLLEEKSLRRIAEEMNLPVMTLYNRKHGIIKKLKDKINK